MFSPLAWFRSKRTVPPTPVTSTQHPALPVADDQITEAHFHAFLKASLRANSQIDHVSLQAAARIFFQVDLPTQLWRLRYTDNSLMYFRIVHVYSGFEGNELMVMRLTLADEALGTSLKLVIDITDVAELLLPVFAPVLVTSAS